MTTRRLSVKDRQLQEAVFDWFFTHTRDYDSLDDAADDLEEIVQEAILEWYDEFDEDTKGLR